MHTYFCGSFLRYFGEVAAQILRGLVVAGPLVVNF